MNDQLKNFLIGTFILCGICLTVFTVLFLKPSVGDMEQILHVRFSDINRINVGTRVLFAGRPVGEVVAINQLYDAREQPTDDQGRVYFYQLTLKVDSSVKIYNTDAVSIETSGLLGEKSVSITPKAPPKGVTPLLITSQPIYADSSDPFEEAVTSFSNLSHEMQGTFKQVTNWIRENGNDLAMAVRSTGSAMDGIDHTMAAINDQKVIDDVKGSLTNFQGAFADIQAALNQLDEAGAFQNAAVVMQNLKNTTNSLESITNNVVEGKGTVGRLLDNDDLYLRVNAIMTKVNTLMNDINHYGVLFHLNKKWQRTRLQQVNELNALATPVEFKAYFQQEVDSINMAMSRISMLIDRADQSPDRDQILHSELFERDFADLLRLTEELNENLKLYNQQLLDAKEVTQ